MPTEQQTTPDRRQISPEALERLRQSIVRHFAEHLYHRVGIRDICTDAQVSPKTVYKYFGTKEELMLGCIEPDLRALTERARQGAAEASTPREALRALTSAQFGFYAEHPAVARVIFLNLPPAFWIEERSPAQTAFQRLFAQQLAALAADARLTESRLALLRDAVSGAGHRVIMRWLVDGERDDLRARGELFYSVLSGLVGI